MPMMAMLLAPVSKPLGSMMAYWPEAGASSPGLRSWAVIKRKGRSSSLAQLEGCCFLGALEFGVGPHECLTFGALVGHQSVDPDRLAIDLEGLGDQDTPECSLAAFRASGLRWLCGR